MTTGKGMSAKEKAEAQKVYAIMNILSGKHDPKNFGKKLKEFRKRLDKV
jgi:hypothetical protein